ncbi:hypothetical protein FBULB1_7215 [Fusarium bulbicola]|nr:hypothetical protein FBULB1_7215 [Fusarium bulbicola]
MSSKLIVILGATGNQGGSVAEAFLSEPGWKALNDWAAQHEEQQLKNVIDIAAKVRTLERFILSSLSHSEKWSKGKYTRVYHFSGKARATEYAQKEHPDLWAKTSVYQAGLFLSNFVLLPLNQPFKNAAGVAQFVSTLDVDTKFPHIAPEEDTGPFVKALIIDEPAGHNLIAYREWLSANDIASTFTKATGIPSKAIKDDNAIPPRYIRRVVGRDD